MDPSALSCLEFCQEFTEVPPIEYMSLMWDTVREKYPFLPNLCSVNIGTGGCGEKTLYSRWPPKVIVLFLFFSFWDTVPPRSIFLFNTLVFKPTRSPAKLAYLAKPSPLWHRTRAPPKTQCILQPPSSYGPHFLAPQENAPMPCAWRMAISWAWHGRDKTSHRTWLETRGNPRRDGSRCCVESLCFRKM